MTKWAEYEPEVLRCHAEGLTPTEIQRELKLIPDSSIRGMIRRAEVKAERQKLIDSVMNKKIQEPAIVPSVWFPDTPPVPRTGPRILHHDIETLPNEGYFFDIFSDRGIALQFVKRPKAICTLSYKWHGEDKVTVLTMSEPYSDASILAAFLPVYEQADYVCGHYAEGFDIPFMDGRLFANGMKPLPTKMVLDTYKIAKKRFGRTLNSNKLDHLASLLQIGNKNKTDASLWVRCAQGEPAAIEEMAAYNAQDVQLLEKVFVALRPWFSKKLNQNLFMDDITNRCKSCASEAIDLIGYEITASSKRPQFRCKDCGAVSSFTAKQAKLQ